MKICKICKVPLDLNCFYKIKNGKFGVTAVCKECISNKNKNKYLDIKSDKQDYYADNKLDILVKKKIFYTANKERLINISKAYYIENLDNIKIRIKENYNNVTTAIKNKSFRLNNPEYSKIYKQQRKLRDPMFKLSGNIRTLICGSFKNKNIKKNTKSEQILGCTFKEFKIHLEKQFDDKMNWDNHGIYWHMDHIKPVSKAINEQELIELNHYTNFQPLEKYENMRKSNKYNNV